jgi:hypothetical protein
MSRDFQQQTTFASAFKRKFGDLNDTKLSGIKPRLVGGKLFVALPVELQRTIEGGCSCAYCKAHPDKTPMWDTLAIDARAQRHTWTVHYPEL